MNKPQLIAVILSLFVFSHAPVMADVAKSPQTSSKQQIAKLNVNTATVDQLVLLPGVGAKKAQAIIDYRTKHGAFKSLEDLTKVKGVGKKMLNKFRTQVSV